MRSRELVGGALRLFVKPRYRFVHIPKNAGIAVRHALALQADVVLPRAGNYHERVRDIAPGLINFGIVRNPWSRTVSRWQFGQKNSASWPVGDARRVYVETKTFADFVRERPWFEIPEHPGQSWMGPFANWFNQLEWLTDAAGNVCDVLRFESLNRELPRYLNRKITLRQKNVTGHDYRAMYSDELAEIVAQTFREDIDHFGFSFHGSATRNYFGANI